MNRIALVTGGAAGLGLAIARQLASAGHEVVIADIDTVAGESAAAALRAEGRPVHARRVDVADEAAVAAFYAKFEREFGRLDILINNAGIMDIGAPAARPIESLPLADWERTFQVNLSGPYLMCQGAVPLMRRGRWGRIVNISSRAARTRSATRNPAYPASKAALIGLSRVLANEVGVDGITVNCVAPSTVDTAMTRDGTGAAEDYFAHQAAATSLGRIGTPDDIAAAVLYLCGKGAAFVTGLVLDVNGGSFMP